MPVQIINIEPQSDGDPTCRPSDEWTKVDPPHLYLSKIAERWLDSRNARTPGVKYYLNKLPAGYRLFERPRPGNNKIVDKHLHGHPKGRYFDSPNRFYPHFEHLMKNGNNVNCPCTVCNSTSTQALPISTPALNPPSGVVPQDNKRMALEEIVKPSLRERNTQVDEEGTPDIVSYLLEKLRLGPLDEQITEPASMDWTASKDVMKEWIDRITLQPSWIPRQGELVLFVRNLSGTQIDYDRSDNTYKVFDENANQFTQLPLWEAGVIAQDANEIVSVGDLMEEVDGKRKNIAYSGFRVEPLAAATNNHTGFTTKGHKYVPLHHIRPFVFWPRYLAGCPREEWHPSIFSAMKVTSSVCLINKHRLHGIWPSADIFWAGLYVGSELLCVGDTASLTPSSGDIVEDFLKIDAIKLRLTNLDRTNELDHDTNNPSNSTIVLKGKAFTLDRSRAWDTNHINQTMLKGLGGYREALYWLHDPEKSMQVTFTRILGRCYDAESMMMWFPPSSEETKSTNALSYGLAGCKTGRSYSSKHDDRILSGHTWFWGDHRLEVLGLETLNNVYASYCDDLRQEKLEEWNFHNKKRKAGWPPKLDRHPMAIGVARALAVSGSENETEGTSAEDENTNKRSLDVAMRHEVLENEHGTARQEEGINAAGKRSGSSTRSSSTNEIALENFKRRKVVIVVDD